MGLKGSFSVPGDKSISHRLVLMSLLARGTCRARNLSSGGDVASSMAAVRELGGDARLSGGVATIVGAAGRIKHRASVDCGNSGTTMRLLMGILAGQKGEFVLDGDESLRRRPMERVADPLRKMGARIATQSGRCPLTVTGSALQAIHYDLPVASAQLKSAVLMAGIQAHGTTTVVESVPSRDHTERLLQSWGAKIEGAPGRWQVVRSELTMPDEFQVPGDPSSAAFFLSAALIIPGSEVTAEKVLLNPTRTGFLAVLQRMGADLTIAQQGNDPEPWGNVTARFTPDLIATEITPQEIPALVDEVPILSLVATQASGRTVFEGVHELRLKESDRLAAIADQLGAMGPYVQAEHDRLLVTGRTKLSIPGPLDSYSDHRIAMTLRLAAALTGRDAIISGEDSVAISYPAFHETLKDLLA